MPTHVPPQRCAVLQPRPGGSSPESPSVLLQPPSPRRQGYLGLHFAHLLSSSIASPEASPLLFDCIICSGRPARRWHTGTEAAALREAALPPRQPAAPRVPPRSYPASSGPAGSAAGEPLPSSRRDVTCPQVFSSHGGFPPISLPSSRCPSCHPRLLTVHPRLRRQPTSLLSPASRGRAGCAATARSPGTSPCWEILGSI